MHRDVKIALSRKSTAEFLFLFYPKAYNDGGLRIHAEARSIRNRAQFRPVMMSYKTSNDPAAADLIAGVVSVAASLSVSEWEQSTHTQRP